MVVLNPSVLSGIVACLQGRRYEGRAKGGNADGKGNFGLMNYSYNVVNINPQISEPRNSYNAEIRNLYAVVAISLQIVDSKWLTMLRYGSVHAE